MAKIDGIDEAAECALCGKAWRDHLHRGGECPEFPGQMFSWSYRYRYVAGNQLKPASNVAQYAGGWMAQYAGNAIYRQGGAMFVADRISELKSFNIDRLDVAEMLMLASDGQRLREMYEARTMPTPEWLTEAVRLLNREIDRRKVDDLEKRLREIQSLDAADMDKQERREARRKERERIVQELAAATGPVVAAE
jgi:hypothetical protein